MDLDDDELWATQYSNRYIKKSKIENKIKELEHIKYAVVEANGRDFLSLERTINVLKELLEEK